MNTKVARPLAIARYLVCTLLLGGAWSCDAEDTFTVVLVDADEAIKASVQRLKIHVESDDANLSKEHEIKEPNWPERLVLVPHDDDASRRFTLRAEAIGADGTIIGSTVIRTGFIADETLYWTAVIGKEERSCESEPAKLARSESAASSCTTPVPSPEEIPAAGDGGSGGASGRPSRAGEGGARGGTGGASGHNAGTGAAGRGGTGMSGAGNGNGNGNAAAGMSGAGNNAAGTEGAGNGAAGMDAAGTGNAGVDAAGAGAGGNEAAGTAGKDTTPQAGADAPPPDVCGDKRKSGDELCDSAIEQGTDGACPTKATCVAAGPCEHVEYIDDSCHSRCVRTEIKQAARGDGCCPDGANNNTDEDCATKCGNGAVELGETCDPPGRCTEDLLCGAPVMCSTRKVTGDPDTCAVKCEVTAISVCKDADGCCPDGCNNRSDSDCSAKCGDNSVDSGETCEQTNPATPCLTQSQCDDGDPCTVDRLRGSVDACNVYCEHTPITAPRADDGCCPKDANANIDNDCRVRCGNSATEVGEQCDGSSCKTSDADCDDRKACTIDKLVGTDCQRTCSHEGITTSSLVTTDKCCPGGATVSTDIDCLEVNLLAGKVFTSTTADSAMSGGVHAIKAATDGDENTRWISVVHNPIELNVDLGAAYKLTRIRIVWAGDTIHNFQFQLSSDWSVPGNWRTFASGVTNHQPRQEVIYPSADTAFTGDTTGRYFQIVGLDNWDPMFGNSIWEIQIYGTAAP